MADDDKHIINVKKVHEMLRTPDDLSGDAADEANGRAWDEIEAQVVKDLRKLDKYIMVDFWSVFNNAFREAGELGNKKKKKK
jgi:hypothetical protein